MFTYDDNQLATSPLFQIRLEIADTNPAFPLLSDEEINRTLAVERNTWGAAARCCEIISRSFLRKADVRIGRGGTTLNYAQAASQYKDMAGELRKRANATVAPWTGGTSLADKAALASDPSKVQPIFTKTSEQNPRVGTQGSDSLTDNAQTQNR